MPDEGESNRGLNCLSRYIAFISLSPGTIVVSTVRDRKLVFILTFDALAVHSASRRIDSGLLLYMIREDPCVRDYCFAAGFVHNPLACIHTIKQLYR